LCQRLWTMHCLRNTVGYLRKLLQEKHTIDAAC
jgi:hypothetical protein